MSESEYGEFSKLASMKKCPFCEGELEKGYFHGETYWDRKRRKHFISLWGSTEKIMSPFTWSVPYAPALKCNDCRIVILDYGKGKKRNKQ